MTQPFIALDWGTTSFRAYLVGPDGAVQNQCSGAEGILAVKDGGFEAILESHIGHWDKALPVVASGMITSRQGWVEVPYVECPAGIAHLANAIHIHTTNAGRKVYFISGLHYNSPTLQHDVLRGEETKLWGPWPVGPPNSLHLAHIQNGFRFRMLKSLILELI
jgi:2-dehydro-3-deoxygalactonokinase